MMNGQEERLQEVYTLKRKAAGPQGGDSLAYQEARARANMYRFLSAIYLNPPHPGLLNQIAKKDFLEELSSLFGEKAVAELKEFAVTAPLDKDMPSLKQEYMDLFAVPTGRYVFPFEDIYRGIAVDGQQKRGPLLGERAIAATKRYREAGAEIDRACKELPTHIGVELGFMSFLCEREASAILRRDEKKSLDSTRCRELQVRFLKGHLNQWFPQLGQCIQRNARSQFYRGLALITEAFLAQETASLFAGLHPDRRLSRKKDGKNGRVKPLECGIQCDTE